METNNKIIEFYGIPGCGKSTISEGLLSNFSTQKAGRISDVMRLYHKCSLIKKITCIPYCNYVKLLWVFICHIIHRGPFGVNRNGYKILVYMTLAYNYFRKQENYNYLIVDHGLYQQFASTLHEQKFQIADNVLKSFVNFAQSTLNAKPYYCFISTDESLRRMKNRNRNTGRIDAIMNDVKAAIELLDKESDLFERLYIKIKDCKKIDMMRSQDEILDSMIKSIR